MSRVYLVRTSGIARSHVSDGLMNASTGNSGDDSGDGDGRCSPPLAASGTMAVVRRAVF